jgi:IS4 transposase
MDEILQRFCERSPIAVMAHAALSRALADTTLDDLFRRHAEVQYTREVSFSAVVKLMTQVTLGTYKSVHSAYQQSKDIPVSIVSVYGKLQNIELGVSQALVQETAQSCREVIEALPLPRTSAIQGLHLRTLDGNFLAGTDHRLKPLRGSGAAALPGMSLVVRDGQTGLLTNVIPCEDAYTNERSLASRVAALVNVSDLWLADRNFCTLDYFQGIAERGGFFLIRHHAGTKLEGVGEERFVGSNESGDVHEQNVRLSGSGFTCRCIVVKLHQPLRDGTTEIRLLTNVSASKASATKLAELYRTRWQIETAFQELTCNLRCEIQTLGYPKAALFGFCLAMLAYNVLTVVKAALAAGQGTQALEQELSSYHMATELATVQAGLTIAVAPEQWRRFATMSTQDFATWLHETAKNLDWSRYRKAKRGPKKPVTIKRTTRGAHRSTARVLKNTP